MKVAHHGDPRGVLEQGRSRRARRRARTSSGGCGSAWRNGARQWFHPSVTIHRQGGVEARRERDSARRHAAHRFRHRVSRLLDRHAAQRVCAEGRRDRRAAGFEGRAQGREQAAGPDDAVCEAVADGQRRRSPRRARRRSRKASCPSIYCHPVGYHGHGAGPPIGMTDYQEGVPVRGDYIVPSVHVALDRAERHAQGARVGRPGRALRARRGRRDHARRQVGLDRRPPDGVLPDQVGPGAWAWALGIGHWLCFSSQG